MDKEGKLLVDKHRAFNKIGHVFLHSYESSTPFCFFYSIKPHLTQALHWLDPNFKRVTFDQKVKDTLKDIGFKDPAVAQSM